MSRRWQAGAGAFGALLFAAWLAIPVARPDGIGPDGIGAAELGVTAILVGFALFTAGRFLRDHGSTTGAIVLVAVGIEVAKRLMTMPPGPSRFSVVDVVVSLTIGLCLAIGVHDARARLDR